MTASNSVEPGQTFESKDQRGGVRVVRVTSIKGGKALCENVVTKKTSNIDVGSLLSRFRRVEAARGGLDESALGAFAAFFDAKAAWSAATFGPGDRYAGVVEHIRKELKEVLAAPGDLVEWVDIVLLAMDGAWRSAGATGEVFVRALLAKHKKNLARTWPDWRTLSPDSVAEHVRSPEEIDAKGGSEAP